MTNFKSNSSHVGRFVLALGVLLLMLVAQASAMAATPAGTDIRNRATITYEDVNGNQYSAQSNESIVTVAEVYSATIENDSNLNGAPGQTVYFSHTLVNTGNAIDTFNLSGFAGSDAATPGAAYSVYLDQNGNGLPDAGESIVTQVTLNPNQQVQLILAVPVPAAATLGTQIDSTILVQSVGGGAGVVLDIGTNSDAGTYDSDSDGTPDGNDSLNNVVTVTTDAVLVATKTAVVNAATNTVRYTLQVANTGGNTAENVNIFDTIPTNSSFVEVNAINGLLASNGDTFRDAAGVDTAIPSDPTTIVLTEVDEPAGIDMNGNGISGETAVDGIFFNNASMGPGTTVSITFTVSFDPTAVSAGSQIRNVFVAQGDTDGGGTPNDPVPSNSTTTTVGQIYTVDVSDTGDAADDDGSVNDIARQDTAGAGSTVGFANVITNNGNGTDIIDFELLNDAGAAYAGATALPAGAQVFPAGTQFSFWNEAGTVQLTDTNGNGRADTGELAPGASLRIQVKAQLPAGFSGTGPFVATMRATSANDPSATPASNTKLEVLGQISAPTVDLANSYSVDLVDAGVDADAFSATTPITTETAQVGGTATFPLFLANNSGNSQSFFLQSTLPAGWSVTFRELGIDSNGDGVINNAANAGNTVSSSPALPGGAVYHYEAVVQVSAVVSQSLAEFTGAVGGVNGDDIGGAYPIIFTVASTSDGAVTDTKLDAVDVTANRNIDVTPDGANQIQPGGNVTYSHIIANIGNSTEALEITGQNSLAADGWSNNTQLFVDTTGNGEPDAWVQINNLVTGTVFARSPSGTIMQIEVDNSGANPVITLEPAQRLDVRVIVYAPAAAPAGNIDQFTLTASNANVTGTAIDSSEVIVGQLRLQKSAFVDTSCACAGGSPTWPADNLFEANPSGTVLPEQCIVWRLTTVNEGSAAAQNVVISDATTAFTTFQNARDAIRLSDGNAVPNSGTAPEVNWNVGNLPSGDQATAQFCVVVN